MADVSHYLVVCAKAWRHACMHASHVVTRMHQTFGRRDKVVNKSQKLNMF
jgi:hypothetical protein